MNTFYLKKAMKNPKNSKYFHGNVNMLKKLKEDAIHELPIHDDFKHNFIAKLKGYIIVEEINDLSSGALIRWISIMDAVRQNNSQYKLKGPVVFLELKIVNEGMMLLCKTFTKRLITIKMDECMIFRKLNNQELILLSAIQQAETEES